MDVSGIQLANMAWTLGFFVWATKEAVRELLEWSRFGSGCLN
jgi:hypothetical protein